MDGIIFADSFTHVSLHGYGPFLRSNNIRLLVSHEVLKGGHITYFVCQVSTMGIAIFGIITSECQFGPDPEGQDLA